jgi:glycosyltransferase involved in cell wall biosynthesis
MSHSESARRRDPHCLVVTKLLPVPADNGGKQRTLAIVRRLAAERPVTIVAFDEGGADVEALHELGIAVRSVPWRRRPDELVSGLRRARSLSSARFWSRDLARAVRDVAAAHPEGTILVEFAQLEPWLRGAPAGRRVLATQNIESRLVQSYAATTRGLRRAVLRLEAAAVARLERRLLDVVDVVGVVSDQDRDRLGDVVPEVVVCPNGQDPGESLPFPASLEVCFVAQLGWLPNVDAAVWFVREVWPLVTDRLGDARLSLVGREPAPEVRALAGPGVTVTGTVPDVQPYLQRASVAVAPLRAGGGTRLKILEALGAGRPVVATTVGAEGLEDLVGHGVLIADEPAAMASAVADLLQDPDRAEALGQQGCAAVRARYSWDATLAPLLDAARGDEIRERVAP